MRETRRRPDLASGIGHPNATTRLLRGRVVVVVQYYGAEFGDEHL